MPSYRLTLTIGRIAGLPPERVLPAFAAAVAERAIVEASDLAVTRGLPRVTVRFTGDDVESAAVVAQAGRSGVPGVEVTGWMLTELSGGRWQWRGGEPRR